MAGCYLPGGRRYVECEACGARILGMTGEGKEEVFRLWNRRTSAAELAAVIQRAEAAERLLSLLENSKADRHILYRTGQGSLFVSLGGGQWDISASSASLRDAIERAAAGHGS